MDPDMNKYDLEHACTAHPVMSKETWEQVYRERLDALLFRRACRDHHAARRRDRPQPDQGASTRITLFSGASRIEGVHPLQFGFVRRKIRTQRRYGMPIVNPLIFYPWRAVDFTRVGVPLDQARRGATAR